MARYPTDGWGSPSFSQDIVNNYDNTHHEVNRSQAEDWGFIKHIFYYDEVDKVMIENDSEYLNSLYDDDLSNFNDNYFDDGFNDDGF